MADLSKLDDQVLWNRATQARCENAFRTLLERHEQLVWNVCNRLLRNSSDVEDAFQMAFIALLEHGSAITSNDFRPWLYRVAYNAALRVQSGRLEMDGLSNANSVPEESMDTEVFESIERAEQSQLIDEALDSLPEKYREVLVLHYCCGVARDDIASQLGLTPQTVKARLSRARKALRTRLVRRGLPLSVAAFFLGANAKACVPTNLRESTLQLARSWLVGEPIALNLAQFSDFPKTESGMKSLSVMNSKWTVVGVVAAVALLLVYEAGHASGSSAGPMGDSGFAQQFTERGTEVSVAENKIDTITPAAHFVAKPALTQARTQAVEPQKVLSQPQTQPVPAREPQRQPAQQTLPTGYITQVVNGRPASMAQSQPKFRGLPDGTWKRDTMFGAVSFLVDGSRLQVDFQGSGELGAIRGSLLGEYSVASDGTIFGLFHGVDVDIPGGVEASGELGPIPGMVSDSPFSMRVHTSGNAMVVKKLTIGLGLPMADGIEEYARVGTMIGMYATGTYRSAGQPRQVGQLAPRANVVRQPVSMPRPVTPHYGQPQQGFPTQFQRQPAFQPTGPTYPYPYPAQAPVGNPTVVPSQSPTPASSQTPAA